MSVVLFGPPDPNVEFSALKRQHQSALTTEEKRKSDRDFREFQRKYGTTRFNIPKPFFYQRGQAPPQQSTGDGAGPSNKKIKREEDEDVIVIDDDEEKTNAEIRRILEMDKQDESDEAMAMRLQQEEYARQR
jgi:hypothetical protein